MEGRESESADYGIFIYSLIDWKIFDGGVNVLLEVDGAAPVVLQDVSYLTTDFSILMLLGMDIHVRVP
jgi:hypothetical protein